MKTEFLRITWLMLGLLTSSCVAMGQTHKQKPDLCKDTGHFTQSQLNDCALKNPMCLAILKQGLTEGRIRDLKALTTSEEGDVCYGYRASGSKSN